MLKSIVSASVKNSRQFNASKCFQVNEVRITLGISPEVQIRYYSSLPKEEEEKEKQRVGLLSETQKKKELKELDKEISRLNTIRGINTGELYTFRGRFKALARDYGMAFMAWYWCVWTSTCALTYASIELGGVDAIALLGNVDAFTGYDISSKVDPTVGTIGLTLAINELLEPLRLPIVVFTTKPIVDRLSSSD